jgi:hypothetical protein
MSHVSEEHFNTSTYQWKEGNTDLAGSGASFSLTFQHSVVIIEVHPFYSFLKRFLTSPHSNKLFPSLTDWVIAVFHPGETGLK